ncbi:MAG TPA: hydantoinase/oxoprolinase family protein [Jatrophihabitantaceae bacterium]|nr:hydantoinase/oxoprolinase family protein [Jatrophihabitantaceae bacterium]
MTRLINIDNGGTLTDICIVDGEDVRYTKTLTTPFDLSRCLFDGLTKASALVYGEERLAALLQSTDYIRYSTTQGTNALVQRKGPRLGLLTTDPTLVEALAATSEEEDLLGALVGDRHAVIDVTAADDELGAQLVERVNQLATLGAGRLVVAIGGPDGAEQERRVKRQLLQLYPRQLLGAIPLLFSWELVADRDDARRTWSALLNAFLHPAMERFLFNTERRLRDNKTRRPLLIFRNDGGSSRVAKSSALKTYSSGPRGGLEGTRALANGYGFGHLLMVDVGGTTTDLGVVADGAVQVDRRGRVAMVRTSFELAAITSHGVGGSSVIRVVDGALTVGPDSVGAAPGPACFGLGGADATITDVYLLMGVLDPNTYLDGAMTLDAERSRKVVQTTVAEPLGLSLDVALARMEAAYLDRVADALRTEPLTADTVIAAFGGAGPMTVCGAAERAGVRRVIIPRTAAVFSAFGIGFSDISQSYEAPLSTVDGSSEVTEQLRRRARRDLFAEGVDLDACVETVRLSATRGEQDIVLGSDAELRSGDVASLELSLVSPLPHVTVSGAGDVAESDAAPTGTRTVLDGTGGSSALLVYGLVDQPPGARAVGPAVIEGPFFTMRLPAGWRFDTTAAGDLLLTDERSR